MSPAGLTINDALLDGELTSIRCENGRIAAIGTAVKPEPGDEVIEAGHSIVVAGLVNGHAHAAMTLFRGHGGDLPLMRWLQEAIWPVEAKLEPEDVYWGTRLACAEMIRSGTTRFWDMYWHPEATARAVLDAGLQATIGAPLIDIGKDPAEARAATLRSLDYLQAVCDAAPAGAGIVPSLSPHAIYTVSEPTLRWTVETATERGQPIQIHLSETEEEVSACIAEHGCRPAELLDRCGMLGPDTVLAHGVWLDRSELELIAERGATVVTNPVANQKLAVGAIYPHPLARECGVAVGLGTDGPGSNDTLDLFGDLKVFALAQKHAARDAAAITAAEAWRIATGQMSELLGGAAGTLIPGAPADLLLLQRGQPELSFGDLHEGLVYSASGAVVDTTIAAGRVLMRGGDIRDLDEVLAKAMERAARLGL